MTLTIHYCLQGVSQTIYIHRKTVLVEVMKQMPAKQTAVFDLTAKGCDGYQVYVDLDVSGSRVTVDRNVGVTRVVGDIGKTADIAELNAVHKAFAYLEKNHFLHVLDYSSQVVDEYEHDSVWRDLNTVLYKLSKVIGKWSVVLDNIANFRAQLERNEFIETTYGVRSSTGDIYAKAAQLVTKIITMYDEGYKENHSLFIALGVDRARVLSECNDKVTQLRLKVQLQFFYSISVHSLHSNWCLIFLLSCL